MKKIAMIDLGSNSVRMNIYDIYPHGEYRLRERVKEMVRLGEGLANSDFLQEKAMRRTMQALYRFKHLLQMNGVKKVIAVATAAVRNSRNGVDFMKKIRTEVGLSFKILSGDEEAYFDYLGIANTVTQKHALIVDVGGGSTELILMKKKKMKQKISLPFGSVTLYELFSNQRKSTTNTKVFVGNALQEVSWLHQANGFPLIGLGGSARALGRMMPEKSNAYASIEIHQMVRRLKKISPKNLSEAYGFSKHRSDVLYLSVLIFDILLDYCHHPLYIPSACGLREGLLFDYLQKKYPLTVE